MVNITRKRTGEFLQKLLRILLANPDGIQAKEALKHLEKQVQLTEFTCAWSTRTRKPLTTRTSHWCPCSPFTAVRGWSSRR